MPLDPFILHQNPLMTQESSKPTRGQLERLLSQRLQALYRDQLGHQPGKVTCQIFDEKVALVIEDSITPPEQLLADRGQSDLAQKVRSELDEAIKPGLKALIEEVLSVCVLDLLSDATLETGRTGIIAVLEVTPEVRNPEAVPKIKK
ncbi:hypothetical protein Mic7113_3634 [Allocoleopsis franciscana PCC 7113]|uniref:Na+-translocating membrane potential-generating system MpsC domain-containing protein n=2 Tax=Allocoleopsis TaxID=2886347 RepID=K9WGN0_9CYAN|nr:hypothetical protein Mic7113_3634 [Allocoleopsis franciscana PCC 7113]